MSRPGKEVSVRPLNEFSGIKHAVALKLWFPLFFLVGFTPWSSLVKVNKETREFIQLVIENSKGQVICFSSEPVPAIPRGTRVKNAVGDSPTAFLVPDILLWDPQLHFPELVLFCLSCDEMVERTTTSHVCCMA